MVMWNLRIEKGSYADKFNIKGWAIEIFKSDDRLHQAVQAERRAY
jgi:hypothetical protein